MKKQLIYLVLLCGLGPLAWAQDGDITEAEYQEKLQELQSTIAELEEELSSVRGDREELLQQLESNESRIGDLLEKIEGIKAQLESEEQALNSLREERQQLAREQSSQKKHLAQQVRAAYRLGGQSNIKLILNQDDPQQVSRQLKYYDYFLQSRSDKLTGYRQSIHRLNDIEPEIAANTQSLARNKTALQQRHDELRDAQQQRQTTLDKLNRTIESKDQQLARLARERETVEKLLAKITSVVSSGNTPFPTDNIQPFTQLRGKLPWPANGRIAHPFGSYRVAGKMKWDGVVIRAEAGSPVQAIHHGRVVFADYLRGQGLLIILDHGDGFMSLYGHNQTLNKSVGSWVEAGEIIASVGRSGGQNQAGLYFEIRHNGKPANPGGWCV